MAFWWLSPLVRLKENYNNYRMSWAKTFRLPYDFCHIFTSRTVEQSETWFKPSGNLATSLTIWSMCQLYPNYLNTLPSKTFVAYEVDVFVFSYYRFINQQNRSWNLKFWKLGNITWGISSDIPQFLLGDIQSRDAFRPITCERKYLMDYKRW